MDVRNLPKLFDISEFPKFTDMKFKFIYDLALRAWAVHDENGSHVADINVDYDNIKDDSRMTDVFKKSTGSVATDITIMEDFKIFMKRPEYQLLHIDIPETISEFPYFYSKIFAGAVFVRAMNHNVGCNPDDAWPQIEKCMTWLFTTDFFTAPASSRFHDAFAGGLCFHSLRVAQKIVDLMHTDTFGDRSKFGDAIFCALVHDWCKINLYESYNKNVKNEDTGVWEKVLAYRYTGNPLVNLGHGVSSMFLASKFFRLNVEEATAIRWHMGVYRVSDEEFNELQTSNEQFMLVHLLQFADQLALVKY